MDGAMATELFRGGLSPEWPCARANLREPRRVLDIHRAYVEAGAEVLVTNTFQAHPSLLARYGLNDLCEEIVAAGVRLARQAAGRGRYVLGSVGPMESLSRREVARVLGAMDGVDGYLFETWSSPDVLPLIAEAFHRQPLNEVPLLLSLAYEKRADGTVVTHSGHGPETYARHAEQHGVAALGLNCGRDIGVAEAVAVLERYRAATDLPLFVRLNAGTPVRAGEGWRYPVSPEEFGQAAGVLLAAGARMVGGCCGTTPADIAALRARVGA